LALLTLLLAATAVATDRNELASRVEIRRTQYGVPHIQADSLEAVAFGFGYCQAEDHLPNILRGVIAARSQLAATFGPDADKPGDNKHLAADLFNLQFRVYRRAVDTYHKLDPDYRSMCEGFADGLNHFMARHPDRTPDWATPVTGHDVAAYGVAGVMRFAFNRGNIIEGFLKQQGVATAALPDEESAEVGSNMWALAPSRSQSGRAMLLGNPHQPWSPVATYYEAHLIVPGRMNFYGSTFIGRPVLTTGFNDTLGWTHTVNYPDLEEIYQLELDAEQPDHYRFDGGLVPLQSDNVRVTIRSSSGQSTVEERTYWHTPLGPVIHRTGSHIYVLRSACYENYRAYEQWLKMTQATNFDEFRQVLSMNQIPMFNICYADRAGNIYYLYNGTVPKLPHPRNTTQAVPARRTTDIWTDFLTTAELPQLVNPPGGYVQNCNSPPFFTNLHAPLNPQDFPPYLRENNVSLRSQHSLQLIDTGEELTLEEVCERKHSPLMLLAERVKPDLIEALRESGQAGQESAIAALEAWDNTVSAESRGGTLFTEWWRRYEAAGGKFATEWSADQPTATPSGLADRALARETFAAAFKDVQHKYERADVTWGEVHRLRKQGTDMPLSGGSGLLGCFRVLEFRPDEDGRQAARGGDSYVFAVEFSDPPRAYTVLAYSQSEIEGSPHYADQAPLFSASKMKQAAFTSKEIEAQQLRKYRPGDE